MQFTHILAIKIIIEDFNYAYNAYRTIFTHHSGKYADEYSMPHLKRKKKHTQNDTDLIALNLF